MSAEKNKAYRYRWLPYGLLLLTYFFVFFHRGSLAAVKTNLESAFNISSMEYSNLGSAYFYTYVVMQIPSGILADTLGARKTVTFGCLTMAIGSVLFGLASSFSILFIARMLVGLGASVIFLSIIKIQSTWFKEKDFGTLTGLTTAVGGFGNAMAQGPLAALVAVLTWRMSFVAIGVFTLLLAVVLYIFVRNRPEDKGYAPVIVLPEQPAGKTKITHVMAEILKCKYIWPVMVVGFLMMGMSTMMAAWNIPVLSTMYDMTATQAGTYSFFGPLIAALSGFLFGIVSDRMRLRKALIIMCAAGSALMCGLLAFAYGGVPPLGVRLVFNYILSFFLGYGGLVYGLVKDVNNPHFSAMSTSMVNVASFLGAALVPLFGGGLIQKYQQTAGMVIAFQNIYKLYMIIAVLACLFSFFILETNCENRYIAMREGHYQKSVFKIR